MDTGLLSLSPFQINIRPAEVELRVYQVSEERKDNGESFFLNLFGPVTPRFCLCIYAWLAD